MDVMISSVSAMARRLGVMCCRMDVAAGRMDVIAGRKNVSGCKMKCPQIRRADRELVRGLR